MNLLMETGKNQPVYIAQTDNRLTPELIEELKENGYVDVYGFKFDDLSSRFYQMAFLLKKVLENSDGGKKLNVENNLSTELYRILSTACYLINSASFKTGKYEDFDRQIVNQKLGRKQSEVDTSLERIVSAATRKNGMVFKGPNHGFIGNSTRGLFQEDGFPRNANYKGEQGFVTSTNRFVNREEAAQLALKAGQIDQLHYFTTELDSSDINDHSIDGSQLA